MHETERHRAIMAALAAKPLLSLADLAGLTGASEATVRRDVVRLHGQGKLTRVRGGAQSLSVVRGERRDGPRPAADEGRRIAEKRAIARAAAALCLPGEAIIINGGSTTYQMVHPLASARLQVFTNSFPVADYLLRHSQNSVLLPSGAVYRDQNIILSPYAEDGSRHFRARRMFVGARSIGAHGLAETDPLLVQAVQRLLGQAEEIVVLADSSKFAPGAGLQVCPLERVGVLITDPGIADRDAAMLDAAGVRLIVADPAEGAEAHDGTA